MLLLLHLLHAFMALTGTICEYESNFGTAEEEKIYPWIMPDRVLLHSALPIPGHVSLNPQTCLLASTQYTSQCQSVTEQNHNYTLQNLHYCEDIWMLHVSIREIKLLTLVNQFLWNSPRSTFYVLTKPLQQQREYVTQKKHQCHAKYQVWLDIQALRDAF